MRKLIKMPLLETCQNKLRGSSVYFLYFLQEGLLYSLHRAIRYPLFVQYMNLPANQFSSLRSLFSLAWSTKFAYSFISDAVPICGLRRLPYILIGLFLIAISVSIIGIKPFPEPYYVINNYDNGTCERTDEVNNAETRFEVKYYVIFFMMWYTGIAFSDSVVDGLITQRSKREPEETRGRILAWTRITGKVGLVTSLLLTGFFMNGVQYGGTFCWSMTINQIMVIAIIALVVGIVYAILFTNEKNYDEAIEKTITRDAFAKLWTLLQTSYYQRYIAFGISIGLVFALRTPASTKIEKNWVNVEPLVKNLINIITSFLEMGGLYLFMRYLLNISWRVVVITQGLLSMILEFPIMIMTVFNIYRNQYFWFADDLVEAIIQSWIFFIAELIAVEYAPQGLEGATFAMFWATCNIGVMGGAFISNFIFGYFNVMEDDIYKSDTPADRLQVFYSFLLSYTLRTIGLVVVFLIPAQKKQALLWKEVEGGSKARRYIFVFLLVSLFIISVITNLLPLFKTTQCMHIAGGMGCKNATGILLL